MQREIAQRLQTIAPADALRIDVDGVGALDLPLAPRTVSRLRAVAKPSHSGLRG